jgi:tellurite resistance protein TerC
MMTRMDILTMIVLEKPLWMWAAFLIFVLVLLTLDLGVFHRKSHTIGVRESLLMSAGYIALGLLYGLWINYEMGDERALEYYTGYIIEKSLSMDNVFVMAVIFSTFGVARKYQHRVLFWGILGVLVLRGVMIGLGTTIIHHFEWVLYLFAAFLIFTGIKLFFIDDDEDPEAFLKNSKIIRTLKKTFPITNTLHGQKFLVRKTCANTQKTTLYMTPLFLTLITIEFADLIFALDSIPAIFAITTDTFVVFTSNIFAILGLRALYFALSAMLERFIYLKYAVAAVLVFIGAKVFVPLITPLDKVPASISLSVTIGLLAVGIIYSLIKTRET